MSSNSEAKLKIRSMVPYFEATSVDGRKVTTAQYKAKMNLVIALLPHDCPNCVKFLKEASDEYNRYLEENAGMLALIQNSREAADKIFNELRPQYQILYDEDGRIAEKLSNTIPAVLVTDIYGELRAEWLIGPDGAFPSQEEILNVIELSNLECPECGAPLKWN